ncbi:MAG TPA: hypothetical protein VLF67_05405 [Candidatus Saccharimonas sp.]|nr:hypothetical protein [Candidatus Saccharimonas sp.]
MNPLPINLNRRNIILLIIIGVVVVIAISLLGRIGQPRHYKLSQPFASNLAFARQWDSHTIRYFSGSAFVTYDTATNKSAPLTAVYSLPTVISDVRWTDSAVLIHATGYSPVDQLYPKLMLASLSPNRYYWWLINFSTGTITLVGHASTGADVRSATWQDPTTYVYTEAPTDIDDLNVIRATIGQDGTKLGTLSQRDILAAATPDSLIYTVPSGTAANLTVQDLSTHKTKTVVKKVGQILSASPNGSVFVIAQPTSTSDETIRGSLVLYNHPKHSTQTISGDFSGSAVWHGNGTDWTATGTSSSTQPIGFTSTSQGSFSFDLPTPGATDDKRPYTSIGQVGDSVLLTNPANQLYYASAKPVTGLPKLADFTSLSLGIYQPTFKIIYSSDQQQYLVHITANPYDTNVKAAQAYLQSIGYDPYQLRLKWYADDGVDPGFYLPASFIPIEEPQPVAPSYGDSIGD